MSDTVLIVTRRGLGEWADIWGHNENNLMLYKADGSVAGTEDEVVLCVANGQRLATLETAQQIIKGIKQEVDNQVAYIAAHGEDNTKIISDLLLIPAATYSLGNNNQPPDGSLGDFVIKLAATIKGNKGEKEFKENLEVLKSAIRGDRLSKAMGSFLTALSPLSLIQDLTIKESACKSLGDLDDTVKSDLYDIFTNMGNELLGLAADIQAGNNQDKVVEWAIQNDSMLKFLARRYL